MESIRNLITALRPKLKQASLLWIEGFLDACSLHRVVIYCLRSRQLAIRTGQCFLLNGFIFLGSIFTLYSVIIPSLEWILPDHCPHLVPEEECSFSGTLKFYSFLRVGLVQLFYVLWFYPLYVFSFILSTLWYNDIAKYGYLAIEKDEPTGTNQQLLDQSSSPNLTQTNRSTDFGGVMIGIAEQAYSLILLNVFFLQVQLTILIPYIGLPLNFLLTSWMYAYYCFEHSIYSSVGNILESEGKLCTSDPHRPCNGIVFILLLETTFLESGGKLCTSDPHRPCNAGAFSIRYKWNFKGLSLDKRLDFFESNWAFFAGFGSPCILSMFVFSRLVSYGILAILFPLFVLTATGSNADKLITSSRKMWKGAGLARIPIFSAADYTSMKVLSLFQSRGGIQDKVL